MPPSSLSPRPFRETLAAALGAIWLVGFCTLFFCGTLPNNPPFTRFDMWEAAPQLLRSPFEAAEKSGLACLPQRLPFLLVAGAILLGAWGLGDLALRVLRIPMAGRSPDRLVLACGLGLSLVSLITLAAGLAGALSPMLLLGLLLGGTALNLVWAARSRDAGSSATGERGGRLLNLGSAAFAALIVLGACLPSFDFDVNAYHFAGPKEYFQNGRIGFLPHNVYTSFPFLTEMLTLLAMVVEQDWKWGAIAGKTVLAAYGPLTALGLYAVGRRWFGTLAGSLAAFVYLTAPWTFRISTIAYVEGALSFYLLAALWATGLAIEARKTDDPAAVRWFALAGLFAGSAMACKYPGLVSAVLPLAVACGWTCLRRKKSPMPLLAFALGCAVTVGPWLVKNLVETGNPVYPLAWSVFGGRDWDAESNAKWSRGHSAHSWTAGDALAGLADVTYRNDWLSPLLFGLAPLSLPGVWNWLCQFFGSRAVPREEGAMLAADAAGGLRHTARGALVACLWLYLLFLILTWWGLTHRIDRFFVPQHPVVALLAGVGGAWLLNSLPSSLSPLPWLALIAATLFNLTLICSGFTGYQKFFADLREAEREAVQATAPEIGWLNTHLPKGAKVLCVGEGQTFYAEFPLVYNTVFDHSIFENWTADSTGQGLKPSDEIRQRLKGAGITHVYVNWREVLRYRTTYGFTPFVTPDRFRELQQRGVLGTGLRMPQAWAPLDETLQKHPAWTKEINRLGKGLIQRIGGRDWLRTFEVFPVT